MVRTAMEDCPLVRAGGRELHHHDIVLAGIGLAVEVSARTVPTDNNGVSTVHLCQLPIWSGQEVKAATYVDLLVNLTPGGRGALVWICTMVRRERGKM